MIRTLSLSALLALLSCFNSHAQEITLDDTQRGAFSQQAMEKVSSLSTYFYTLCDKKRNSYDKEEAAKLALKLFVDGRKLVEISSKKRDGSRKLTIKEYLTHLRLLPYEQVEITTYDVHYVSELKKGPDGKYHATISFFQKFRGLDGEGREVYSDQTQKNVDVVVEMYDTQIGDQTFQRLNVLLGNISVVETK